jgi:hypothetical protein
VVEYFRPIFVGPVGCKDDGTAFVTLAEDLEKEVGSGLVDGQVAQFVEDKKAWLEESTEFLAKTPCHLGSSEGVDGIDGSDE